MRISRRTYQRIFVASWLFTALWMLMLAEGCTASWVSQATQIIQLLVPSITSILGILAAFGVGIAPTALTAIQSWGTQAATDLQTVAGLINQYNTADATAQPGLLTEIETTLNVVLANLKTILPELHITDPATQAKVTAVIDAFVSELGALINLVPAIQGKVTDHEELKTLIAAVQSANAYKADFNSKVSSFGKQYELK